MYKNTEESAVLIGELLLVALLKATRGETSIAINMNKPRITTDAPKYLFKGILSTWANILPTLTYKVKILCQVQ